MLINRQSLNENTASLNRQAETADSSNVNNATAGVTQITFPLIKDDQGSNASPRNTKNGCGTATSAHPNEDVASSMRSHEGAQQTNLTAQQLKLMRKKNRQQESKYFVAP